MDNEDRSNLTKSYANLSSATTLNLSLKVVVTAPRKIQKYVVVSKVSIIYD